MDDINQEAAKRAIENLVTVDKYIEDCMRTCSDSFYGSLVHPSIINAFFKDGVETANKLDRLKKTLFYGRDNGFRPHSKFVNKLTRQQEQVLHGILGVFTEGGELLEALSKEFDPINVREEIGDVLWYLAILCDALETDIPTEMRRNINKLHARFPEKFTSELANNRDLETERKVLEDEA